MTKAPTNTLHISGLTAMEVESYFERFGETGWLDCEEKILIDVKALNEFELSKYDMFFGLVTKDYDWIIVDLSEYKKH